MRAVFDIDADAQVMLKVENDRYTLELKIPVPLIEAIDLLHDCRAAYVHEHVRELVELIRVRFW